MILVTVSFPPMYYLCCRHQSATGMGYWHIFIRGYRGYAGYFWHEVTHPGWHNYFYWLILVSAFFLALEWLKPWRKGQPRFRKDFWLDGFYMFFNFFLFAIGLNGIWALFGQLGRDLHFSVSSLTMLDISGWPAWAPRTPGSSSGSRWASWPAR